MVRFQVILHVFHILESAIAQLTPHRKRITVQRLVNGHRRRRTETPSAKGTLVLRPNRFPTDLVVLLGFVQENQLASGRAFVAETTLEFVLLGVGLLVTKFVLIGDESLIAVRATIHPFVGVRLHVKSVAYFSCEVDNEKAW